jgi:Tfp pilus assembly protein PilV
MKHIPAQRRPQQGYMLLESLISFVVVGVGILGATKLNTTILQSASASKARAEATALAQTAIENARNYLLPDGCGALVTPESAATHTGVNAAYTISTTYTPQTNPANTTQVLQQNVTVTVNWDNDQITLSSAITCAAPGTSAMVGDGGAANQIGGGLAPPSGRAVVGGPPIGGTGTPNQITTDGGDVADGTSTRKDDTGIQLFDSATNKVLLTMGRLACEDADELKFSTISGRIYIRAAASGSPSVPAEDLMVLPSNAGFCSVLSYDRDTTQRLPANVANNRVDFFYTHYKCYVGAGWYGNIGVVLTGTSANTAAVCTGNPGASVAAGNTFSAHPQLGNKREYWGYNTGRTAVIGIGFTDTTPITTCPTPYEAIDYLNHDFVVGSGLASDADCSTAETVINTHTNSSLNENTAADPPYYGNPGQQYCMTPLADHFSCPE